MLRASITHLLTSKRRQAGTGLAILLSVGFLIITLLAGEAMRQGFRNSAGASFTNIDLAVDTLDGSFTDDDIQTLAEAEGISNVQPAFSHWSTVIANGRNSQVVVAPVPAPAVLRDALQISTGRLPESEGEVVLPTSRAQSLRVQVGESVTLQVPDPAGRDGRSTTRELVVVGTWSARGTFGLEGFDTLVSNAEWQRWGGNIPATRVYVIVTPTVTASALIPTIDAAMGSSVFITSASTLIDNELADREAEWGILIMGINAFAVLTLIVAAIVVSNTLSILIAQRTREIALFRCAGATSGQVRGMMIFEAALTGLVASIGGVVIAVVLAQAGLRLADTWFESSALPTAIMISPVVAAGAILAGVLMAIAAAWLPARAAMQIDPLQALRASQAPTDMAGRPGGFLILLALALACGGVVLLLAGIVLSLRGALLGGVMIGMLGGVVSFLAVLTGARVLVPLVARLLGSLVSLTGGVPARIASSNSVRNPRRTTGTAMALVIGITLVTMMTVGAASLKSTLLAQVDAEVPLDLQISLVDPQQQAGFRNLLGVLDSIDGVTAVLPIERLDATLSLRGDGEQVGVYLRVAEPDVFNAVWRGDAGVFGLMPGTILLPEWATEIVGAASGDTIAVEVGGEMVTLLATENDTFDSPLVSPADITTLPGERTLTDLWLRLDDPAQAATVTDAIYAQADAGGVVIDVLTTSDYRQTLENALNSMLLLVTGLLGVAVLISIVGVSNTLTLSVIERTRESALLRSLGFTRRQLRLSLACEGLLLALISSVIGTMLGIAYGWIGLLTLAGDTLTPVVAMPWGSLAVIVLVALGCGVLASVLPARRAAQTDPVVALADR